jgi:hypothetical protein
VTFLEVVVASFLGASILVTGGDIDSNIDHVRRLISISHQSSVCSVLA